MKAFKRFLIGLSFVIVLTGCVDPNTAVSFKERPEYEVNQTEGKPIIEQVEGIINEDTQQKKSLSSSEQTDYPSTTLDEAYTERRTVKVTEVVDVDTIKFFDPLLGSEVTGRLIGVNGPEYTKEKQYLGKEGTEFLTKLIIGQEIQIEGDPNAGLTDRYGRYLIHAFVGGKSIQQILLMEGLVRIAYLYGKYSYIDTYEEAEAAARKAGLNIWGIPGYVDAKNGFNMNVINSKLDTVSDGIKEEVLKKANEWKNKLSNNN